MGDNAIGWDGPIEFTLTADQEKEISRFSMQQFKASGFFSSQIHVKTGAVTIKYEVTNVKKRNVPADAWDDTATALHTAQAVGWSGIVQYPASGEVSFGKQVRIMATDTSGSGATGDYYPNIQ